MGQYSVRLLWQTAGLPAIRLTATHRMSADIFASIVELGSQRKKAKRKGKKKVSKSVKYFCINNVVLSLFFCRKNENEIFNIFIHPTFCACVNTHGAGLV